MSLLNLRKRSEINVFPIFLLSVPHVFKGLNSFLKKGMGLDCFKNIVPQSVWWLQISPDVLLGIAWYTQEGLNIC